MFDVANYTTADLLDIRMTQYDPKDHEQDPGDRLPLYYYVIRIPGWAKIADNVPPAPQRANQARVYRPLSTSWLSTHQIQEELVEFWPSQKLPHGVRLRPKKKEVNIDAVNLLEKAVLSTIKRPRCGLPTQIAIFWQALLFLSQPSLQHELSGICLWFLVSSESDLGSRKRVDVLWRWPVTAHL